jgi:hypothetical protein
MALGIDGTEVSELVTQTALYSSHHAKQLVINDLPSEPLWETRDWNKPFTRALIQPVVVEGDTIAVLEFFRTPDKKAYTTISENLGDQIAQKIAESGVGVDVGLPIPPREPSRFAMHKQSPYLDYH